MNAKRRINDDGRARQGESRLRKVRRLVYFLDSEKTDAQAGRLIARLKARLRPVWRQRWSHASEAYYQQKYFREL